MRPPLSVARDVAFSKYTMSCLYIFFISFLTAYVSRVVHVDAASDPSILISPFFYSSPTDGGYQETSSFILIISDIISVRPFLVRRLIVL